MGTMIILPSLTDHAMKAQVLKYIEVTSGGAHHYSLSCQSAPNLQMKNSDLHIRQSADEISPSAGACL